MNNKTIESVAARLLEARRTGTRVDPTGADCSPASIEEAYAIQDRVAANFGRVRAWKVGAPTPSDEPTCAPMLSDRLAVSPARFDAASFHLIGLEAEIAFRFARDLPARGSEWTLDEVLEAIGGAHAAIEIVDTRLADRETAPLLWKLADNFSNGGFVLGTSTAYFRGRDLLNQPLSLEVNGRVLVEKHGGNPAGDPLRLLPWIANHLATRTGGLKAGDVVTTGAFAGPIFVEPGTRAVARFPGIGEALVEI